MKKRIFVLTAIIICTVFTPLAFCRNGSATTPVSAGAGVGASRSATNPVSRRQDSYVSRKPKSSDTNRLISFNVTGDGYFLGTVPYGSVSGYGTDYGSNNLYSFIRRSDGVFNRGVTNMYQMPSRMATSTRAVRSIDPGRSHAALIGEMGKYAPKDLSSRQPISTYYQKRPSLTGVEKLERLILKQPELAKIREAAELARKTDAAAWQKKSAELDDILTNEPQKPAEPALVEDTYENLKTIRQRRKEELLKRELMEEIAPVEIEPGQEEEQNDETGLSSPGKYQETSAEDETPEADGLDEYNKATDLHAHALEIRGDHTTFADYAKAKFKTYIQAAQEFIKEGRYYMAADAYSLAEVYNPGNIEAITGMAHNLFAAGEYMSSAFLLRKALRLQPEYAKETTHLGQLLIDRDMIENRVIELERCVNASKASELSFLMAYILYRTDRPDTAMSFIDIAAEKMTDSPAVLNLKVEIKKACKF